MFNPKGERRRRHPSDKEQASDHGGVDAELGEFSIILL